MTKAIPLTEAGRAKQRYSQSCCVLPSHIPVSSFNNLLSDVKFPFAWWMHVHKAWDTPLALRSRELELLSFLSFAVIINI